MGICSENTVSGLTSQVARSKTRNLRFETCDLRRATECFFMRHRVHHEAQKRMFRKKSLFHILRLPCAKYTVFRYSTSSKTGKRFPHKLWKIR